MKTYFNPETKITKFHREAVATTASSALAEWKPVLSWLLLLVRDKGTAKLIKRSLAEDMHPLISSFRLLDGDLLCARINTYLNSCGIHLCHELSDLVGCDVILVHMLND